MSTQAERIAQYEKSTKATFRKIARFDKNPLSEEYQSLLRRHSAELRELAQDLDNIADGKVEYKNHPKLTYPRLCRLENAKSKLGSLRHQLLFTLKYIIAKYDTANN